MVRAAADAIDDEDKFIPVCPTKGDVVIIIIYAMFKKADAAIPTSDAVAMILTRLSNLKL